MIKHLTMSTTVHESLKAGEEYGAEQVNQKFLNLQIYRYYRYNFKFIFPFSIDSFYYLKLSCKIKGNNILESLFQKYSGIIANPQAFKPRTYVQHKPFL